MDPISGLRRVFRLALFRRDVEGDVQDELAFHLELKVADLVRSGWTEAEARAEAQRRFGDYDDIRREVTRIADRRQRKVGRMERMGRWGQDLRYGLRQIRRHPGFATVAVLTLALGIGATTAIFSVVHGVILRSLPYPEPDRLVAVWVDPSNSMSYPDLRDVREETDAVEALAGYSRSDVALTVDGAASLLASAQVSGGLLSVMQVPPLLGRDLREEEFGANAAPVAVISHGTWQRLFGGAPDVLGQSLEINGIVREVVGVAPEGFDFPGDVEIWLPRQIDPEGCGRGCHTWATVGRLAAGATLEQAAIEADRLAESLSEAHPQSNFEKRFAVVSLQDDMVGDVRAGLWIVLAAVTAVLLIACVNVANLLLVRATERSGEMAVRRALGAGRGRLATQLLVESGLLAITGGALGLALAWGGVAALRGLSAGTIPRIEDVTVDLPVVLFALSVVVLVTLVVGLVPALRGSESSPGAELARVGRGRSGVARQGPRRVLVALEVGLSVVLLVAAGLMIRSFHQMAQVELGYQVESLTRFRLSLPGVRYATLPEVRDFYRGLEDHLAALPGVEAVGSAFGAPLAAGNITGDLLLEGEPEPEPGQEIPASLVTVSPGYLETMRIPVVQGRPLVASDDGEGPPVTLINETMARRAFPGEDPIGRRIGVTARMFDDTPDFWEIVGVVRDVRSESVTQEPVPEMYLPQGRFGPATLWVTIRSTPGGEPSLETLRETVRSLDPTLPIRNFEQMRDAISREVAPTRFYLLLIGLFAGLALLLAAIGIYGVLSYLVTTRRHEIGVRVALGADRARIVRLTIVEGLAPALVGLGGGLAMALAGGRVMESLLYGVAPRDPLVLVGIPVVLLLVALVAVTIPSLRAARIDPAEALRAD